MVKNIDNGQVGQHSEHFSIWSKLLVCLIGDVDDSSLHTQTHTHHFTYKIYTCWLRSRINVELLTRLFSSFVVEKCYLELRRTERRHFLSEKDFPFPQQKTCKFAGQINKPGDRHYAIMVREIIFHIADS